MADPKGPKFEEALLRLEEIVKSLEAGDLALDGAITLFEEGVRLAAHCTRLLDEAEKRIETVAEGKDGTPVLTEFQAGSPER